MIRSYLPRLMASGCFESYRLHKLVGLPQEDAPTYAVQLMASSKKMLDQYLKIHEEEDQNLMLDQFGDKLVEFRTVMLVVDEGHQGS